jgi:hypothetical protein
MNGILMPEGRPAGRSKPDVFFSYARRRTGAFLENGRFLWQEKWLFINMNG